MDEVRAWLSSGRTYTVRFGLGVLLGFYLDEGFDAGQLELAARMLLRGVLHRHDGSLVLRHRGGEAARERAAVHI